MSLSNTPAAERLHIGIFGRINAGKSSIINAVTAQNIAIVSQVKGTTTDPVYKTMELLPLGPVMIIDTPGLDDEGELGKLRIQRTYQVLNKTDIAVLVVDGVTGMSDEDNKILSRIKDKNIPYIVAFNRADLPDCKPDLFPGSILVSALTNQNIELLKEEIAKLSSKETNNKRIVGDILEPNDLVVLVVPIDSSAPKGRLILPQQQTIRDILDSDSTAIVTKDTTLKDTLAKLGQKPRLVITDSQAFARVNKDTPNDIMLTSFSILFSRYKGKLDLQIKGATALEKINDNDYVLISEGCTHHRQCEDIGTVKLPGWINKYTKKKINFEFTGGTGFPDDLSKYALVVHCGGCMLNEREMKYRLQCAEDQNVPITNYGVLIAYMNGILKRSVAPFKELSELLCIL
ncbi:MAG: [FeFe] hydrogenase H-cluster maturation GTPase HydF [Candidatus Riflebacteria bacterium]|nr:[FeFe] hydrogenase H-cluster maturation GTPase HydF [Candidatus Riflebacteria bacterium]